MYIIFGAFVGALFSTVISWGLFLLSRCIPIPAICNCCGCLWSFTGAVLGAAWTVRFSPKGGGAGTGTAVGGLSGFMGGIIHCCIVFLGVTSVLSAIPSYWPTLRQEINERFIARRVRKIESQQLKTDVTTLLRNMQKHEDFNDAYKEFQVWLIPERIELLVEDLANDPMRRVSTEDDKEHIRQLLREIKDLDFEDAIEKAQPIIFFGLSKKRMALAAFVLAILYSLLYSFIGLFGGLLGGALFTKATPAPPMQKEPS